MADQNQKQFSERHKYPPPLNFLIHCQGLATDDITEDITIIYINILTQLIGRNDEEKCLKFES